MSDVVDQVKSAEVAVEAKAKSLREKAVAYVRANAFKASGISAVLGAAVAHFVL